MATYLELYEFPTNPDVGPLSKRIQVALTIKAWAIIESASPTATALAWAKDCLSEPQKYTATAFRAAIADNAAVATSVILAANDTQVQTVVNNLVDKLLAR